MKFAIITHVVHLKKDEKYFGYGPYIREMNIWLKYVDELVVVAPLVNRGIPLKIDNEYDFQNIDFIKIPDFNFVGVKNTLKALFKLPVIFWNIFWAMKAADHIHLRCPGNVGLLGCMIQTVFPKKAKTAKYAGNWDPKSKQPWTYRLQKWILNNTFLTRNMQVLVYGEWENQSKNIKPFFTATYLENEKETFSKSNINLEVNFIFVGSLVSGKNPMYAVKLIENLAKTDKNVALHIFGEGIERTNLEVYIKDNLLENFVYLHGNQDKETIKQFYKKSHFVILPSKSEGWPKAIAEGMFWRCVPIATEVSCIPYMLDYEGRGVLLKMDLYEDFCHIEKIIKNELDFLNKSEKALEWSRKYTLDLFENEIKKILIQ